MQLAERFGTPTYVFDTGALQERARKIEEIFGGGITLCYSIKANPFLIPAVTPCVHRLEVCSPGELAICESLHVDPQSIVYSGVCKRPADIKEAIAYGAGIYTAESKSQFALLEQGAKEAGKTIPVLLRLTAQSQFGMSKEDLFHLIDQRADYPHLEIEGIHYFVGTQRKNRQLHRQKDELSMLGDLFREVKQEHGFVLRKLEYGPGLPVPLFAGDDFSDTLAPAREIADALREAASFAEVTVEMGRFLATECGYYMTSVVDTKSADGKDYCLVDGGINHVNYLGQIMGMKVPVIRHFVSSRVAEENDNSLRTDTEKTGCPAETKTGRRQEDGTGRSASDEGCLYTQENPMDEAKTWAVCGSLCTTNDDLVRAASFRDLHMGDLLAFENIGAYSVTEGIYLFLSRTMPRIVLYNKDSDAILARDFVETSPLNTIRN